MIILHKFTFNSIILPISSRQGTHQQYFYSYKSELFKTSHSIAHITSCLQILKINQEGLISLENREGRSQFIKERCGFLHVTYNIIQMDIQSTSLLVSMQTDGNIIIHWTNASEVVDLYDVVALGGKVKRWPKSVGFILWVTYIWLQMYMSIYFSQNQSSVLKPWFAVLLPHEETLYKIKEIICI